MVKLITITVVMDGLLKSLSYMGRGITMTVVMDSIRENWRWMFIWNYQITLVQLLILCFPKDVHITVEAHGWVRFLYGVYKMYF